MYDGEKLNAWTHLVGAVLALVGAVVLVVLAALDGDAWKLVSVSIYGVTLVLLYSFSAMYHSFRGRAKDILRKLDHQSIYLLIAGSYTPFCLVTLRGPWGWSLLGTVWGLAEVAFRTVGFGGGSCVLSPLNSGDRASRANADMDLPVSFASASIASLSSL